ncbi:hypothetical protein MSAN_00682600 [Mycena sanguinolenta]|uniref:Uncharacterized protein n=1 Tax=Mycena sanguinolenta TaxID=230812 RepID=A0A8H6Z4D3_9AGAR|nr:hypothetical protein MSAN_00682600 [Mycena sanguinolenta]
MSSVSPDRPPIKKTYLSRQKKNKNTSSDTSSSSEEEQDTQMPDAKPASKAADAKPQSKASRKDTAPPAPVSPGKAPKKVDVHLPGPSPRTAKAKAEAQDAPSSAKKAKTVNHTRSASSVSSMKGIVDASDSPSSKKPISSINRKRFATPEDVDDNASVAESSISMGVGTIRRTEAERIEYFNNQADATNIEPHNVTCTRCNKVVQLGRKQTYTVKPWENHRKRCDQMVVPSGSVVDDGGSVRGEMRSEAGGTVRTTEAQRKAILEADQRAETVQVDQVLCRKCQKWIRLSTRTNYALGNWTVHQASCADAVVSSRVAMAQRKIQLVNDPQAKSSGPRNVECRICGTNVALVGEWDYTLTSWEAHKQTCPAARPPKTPRAPRSSVSTEATVVAGPSSEASSNRGTKRRLEDPELDVDDPDARQPNRPRTETYEPVQKEPPSLLGWFLMPFKAFMQGVKESITETPP